MSDTAPKTVSHHWIRIALPAVLTVCLFSVAIFTFFFSDLEEKHIAGKKDMLSEVTETAWSILDRYESLERQGLLTGADARRRAIEEVRVLRYGPERMNYFFLTDMQHRMVMHPYRPEFEGTDMTLTDDVDVNGTPLSVEFVRIVKESGEGFARYNWQWNNNRGVISPKLSFVKGFLPWDWYIGTGVYIDDVKAEFSTVKERFFSAIAAILFLVFLLTFYLSRQAILAEKKRLDTENALHKSQRRYKELADSLPQFVFEADRNGHVTFVNRFCREVLGYAQADIDRGMTIFEVLIPDDRDRARANFQEILTGKKTKNSEYAIRTREGKIIPVLFHSQAINNDKSLPGIRGVGIDITEQKAAQAERERLERQLQQTRKMETIGTLAGGIAHDFNNILAAVLGYADLIEDSLADDDPNTYNVKQILHAGYRARDLVKQILTFSRQDGQEKQPLQLDRLAKEALKFLRASIPATIDMDLEISAPPEKRLVLGNPTQIHQVILNLCTNSAFAMKQSGGRIHLTLSAETLDGGTPSRQPDVADGTYLKLEVRDTGPGISPDIMDRIFDPFFTTKKRGEGTGMGLSLVHGIVNRHGGFIDVAGSVGEGAAFSIYLPIYEGTANSPVGDDTPPPKGNERILMVDDEEMLTKMGETMFKSLGYDVVTATRARDAVELFRREPKGFDLVFTDLTMPDLTGIDLAKEVMKIRADIPVILCTGFSDQIDPNTLKELGIVEVLLKPPLKRDIAAAIRRALDNKKQAEKGKNGESPYHR